MSLLLGGSWNADGVILFGSNNGPIIRVSSAGGNASPVTTVDRTRDETNHTDPIFLPDGRRFLYLRRSSRRENAGIYVGSLDAKPGQHSLKRIQPADFNFGYTSPRSGSLGHLLFLQDDNLVMQSFDDRRLEVVGEPVPIAEQVGISITRAFFSVSKDVLAYRGGGGASTQLTWYDREGQNLGRAGEPGFYEDVVLSRDASHVAYTPPSEGGNRQIWSMSVPQGISNRVTFLQEGARSPVWSPDGKFIAYSSVRGSGIYLKAADNTGSEVPIIQSGGLKFGNDWSHDGRYLLYTETGSSLNY